MFNKKMLAASMAIAVTTGGLVTQSNAMEVAANDVGQVLLGGAYYVENGYTTDMVVVNTRTDAAVQAKVVFRSHVKSAEVLDFFIWLSPGDTWRGTLSNDGGLLHISSADDSVRNLTDTEWGDVDPLEFTVSGDKVTDPLDSTTFGHFEVISYVTAGGDGGSTAYTTPVVAAPDVMVVTGMTKDDVRRLLATNVSNRSTDPSGECMPADLVANQVVSTIAACSTEIMGEVVIANGTNRASYKPTALAYPKFLLDRMAYGDPAELVIANPTLNLIIGSESLIGAEWEMSGGEWINEVEMALAASTSSYPWESNGTDQGTHAVAAFVTKYRHEGDIAGFCGYGSSGGRPASNIIGTTYSAPFADTHIGEVEVLFSHFDNSENTTSTPGNSVSGGIGASATTLPDEVNYIVPAYMASADSGWAYFDWVGSDTSSCSYDGVPAVTYTYKFENNSDLRHMMETMSNKHITPLIP